MNKTVAEARELVSTLSPKLREIAKVHIARCEAGDMQAIKDLADRLDGKPAQVLEHSGPDSNPIKKIVREIVYLPPDGPKPLEHEDEPVISYSALKIDNTQ